MAKSKRVQKSKSASGTKSRAKVVAPIKKARSKARPNSKQEEVLGLLQPIWRHNHRRHHEGDRLAAAFRPRVLCRCRAQEARACARIRKG